MNAGVSRFLRFCNLSMPLQVDAFFPTGLWFGLDNSTVVEVRGSG